MDYVTDLSHTAYNNPFLKFLLLAVFFALCFWAVKNFVKFILFTCFGFEFKPVSEWEMFKKLDKLKR